MSTDQLLVAAALQNKPPKQSKYANLHECLRSNKRWPRCLGKAAQSVTCTLFHVWQVVHKTLSDE